MSDFKHSRRSPDGWGQMIDPSGSVQMDFIQCVHCGGHRQFNPALQQKLQWCSRCNGFICGPNCLDCVPIEKWLDCVERGVDPKTVTTVRGGWSGK